MRAIILVGVLILFISCDTKSTTNDTKYVEKADQTLDSASVHFTTHGDPNAILHALRIEKFTDKKITIGKNIRIDFKGNTNEGGGNLVADSGIVFDNKNIIEVHGNVHLKTERGTELFSESLFWDTKNDKIWTDSKVRIKRNGEFINGIGLETDIGFKKLIIKENISGEFSG
jgi:LPS export ABC transporter protein LptC